MALLLGKSMEGVSDYDGGCRRGMCYGGGREAIVKWGEFRSPPLLYHEQPLFEY